MRATSWFVALLILGPIVGPSVAADPPSEARIREAIQQLGDKKFAVRERASKFLWEAGVAAEQALREAANSSDPEVVHRARKLLGNIAYRVDSSTPADVVALIERFRTAGDAPAERSKVIRDMIALGGKSHKYILRVLDAVEESERRLILDQFVYGDWTILSTLIAQGHDALVEQLLDRALSARIESAVSHYAAFHAETGKLDEKIAGFRKRVGAGSAFDARVLFALCRIKGDGQGAIEAAAKTEDITLIRQSLMEMGRWQELLERRPPKPNAGLAAVADLGLLAAYQRLAGKEQDFAETVKQIELYPGEKTVRRDNRAWYAAKVLLVNEQPRKASDLLMKFEIGLSSADILIAEARFGEAVAITEKYATTESPQQYAAQAQHIALLLRLGETAKAREWIEKSANRVGDTNPVELARRIGWEAKVGRRDAAEKRLLDRLEGRDGNSLAMGFAALFPTLGSNAEVIWPMLAQTYPDEKPEAQLKRLRSIDDRTMPRAEMEAVLKSKAPTIRNSSEASFEAVAQVVARFGLADLALVLLTAEDWKNAPAGAKLHLADALADAGRWPDAARAYRIVADLNSSDPLPLFLLAHARLRLNAADAEAKVTIERARRMPLGGNLARGNFSQALAERGFSDDAHRQVEFCCRLTATNAVAQWNAQNQLAKFMVEKGEFATAAAIHERNILRFLPITSGLAGAGFYGRWTAKIHIYRARALLAQGMAGDAIREAERAEALQSGNLELAISLVPALERAGEKKLAAELFDRVRTRWQEAARDFPECAEAHNNLAWLHARCRRSLDAALEHAQKAARIAPGTATYLDTLAEVHFQRGDRDKAVELAKKCLAIPSTNTTFYRLQLKRFEKGDPKVEPAAE